MTDELFPKDFFAALSQLPLNNRYADYSNSAALRAAQQRSLNRRNYQAGDSRKLVDWRSSARSMQLMVQPLQDAHSRNLLLCLDRSASTLNCSADRDFAQRRLAFALGMRCLTANGNLDIIAGTKRIGLAGHSQISQLQDFLQTLSSNQNEDIDFSMLPTVSSTSEMVLLSDPWLAVDEIIVARQIRQLRCLLLLTERELNLPTAKLRLRNAETHELLQVDWRAHPPQQRFGNHVDAQLQSLKKIGFNGCIVSCPAVSAAVQLVENSREFLLH
ncbi:MAG: DUF58 domain-containing protein [Planctomycetes bacterium]|nr:DUF58 domain-containing protein [Planctomycetota bacterium]